MQTMSRPATETFVIASVADDFKKSLRTATEGVPPCSLLEEPFPIPTMRGTWFLKRGYLVEELKLSGVYIHGTGSFNRDSQDEDEAIIYIEIGNFDRKGSISITPAH